MVSPKDKKAFQQLVEKYQRGKASPAEIEFIEAYFDYFEQEDRATPAMSAADKEDLEARMLGKIETGVNEAPVIPMRARKPWRLWLAAAVLLFALAGAGIYSVLNKPVEAPAVAVVPGQVEPDVAAPAKSRAMIELANGERVYLDSAASGSLATQANVKLTKLADGSLSYTGAGSELVYNTIVNPYGSEIVDMTFSDGSRVWLNAGSSVRFPVAFIGNERKVSMTGEAYFEIAHNAQKPFKISKGATEVTVLGTHFNVNAYDDDNDIRVTLLEGSVKVKHQATEKKLLPGQQAQVAKDGAINTNTNADVDAVMAWKNGKFSFSNADVREIMKQVGRWYDLEVIYQGEPGDRKFAGEIPRTSTLSEVLTLFKANKIRFDINPNQKTITVMP